ncbi:arylesterase [Gymnodinialimonas ulvae]|uniref:arylesterase n=1 Tax=Gymnodinialimonas ulvae TaxID=3126504 RepID=UPI00309EA5B4
MGRGLWCACSSAYGAARRASKPALLGFVSFLAAAVPAAAQDVVIAALGDSLTQGYGLLQEDGFVPQMEGWLQARGHDVRLINAGVSGDTTAGGLARAAWTLTEEVDAMIVTLGGNDLLRAIPPEASRANLAGILDVATGAGVEVLLVGMSAPGNYGPDYKQAFDAMYPDLAAQYGTLYAESFFAGFEAMTESDPAALSEVMQSDGIHPNAEGVALIVEALGPQVEALIVAAQAE